MAIDLVDGRAGKPHIDGDDLGDFKAGVCGTAGYVLCTGDVLEATQDDANHVTIGTGAMVMPGSGRHVRVTSPEQVTVTSGTQGQKRRDLIVMRADTGGSVESASLVCVRGTPVSYGTPADPAVEDGDLPLYRVELDGATAAAPVAVFDVLTPMSELRAGMDELRDSVSQSLAKKLDASRVHTGNKVIEVTLAAAGQWTASDNLLQPSDLQKMLGRAYDSGRDSVNLWNADWDSAYVVVLPFCHVTSKGANFGVMVQVPQGISGGGQKRSIRIGYMIVKGD